MYDFQRDAIVKRVTAAVKADPKKSVPALVRSAVEGTGVTHKPDVDRIVTEICSFMGIRSGKARRERKQAKENWRHLRDKIAP